MRSISLLTCCLSLLALSGCANQPLSQSAGSVAPRTAVEFVQPERFTDVGDHRYSTARMRAFYLDDLGKYITRNAERFLPPGQRLSVTVTDVDMAGNFEPWRRRAYDVRVIRDIYPPRIDLQFQLTAAEGTLVREGARQLRDMGFLTMASTSFDSDELRYEKALLLAWMQSEFGLTH